MQQLQPNTTLQGGKYKIVRVLGQGGFGITYLATQTSLQRKVAIKEFFMKDFCSRDSHTMLMQSFTAESAKQVEQYRKKFFKEAGNLSRLHHPNIISVIDVFEENGTVYYSMPYYSGGSLQEYVDIYGYGNPSKAIINGIDMNVLPIAHPRQIGALGAYSEKWFQCHWEWENRKK